MQEFVMPAQTSNSSSQIAPLSKPTQNHAKSSDETKNMIAIMTSQRMSAAAADPLARNSKVDVSVEQSDDVDSRSSSLSDPDDAMEDRANPSNKDNMAIDDAEGDSEAETDVLTPRKAKSATLPTNGTSNNVDKSPSKLIQQLLPDDSSPPLVESIAEDIPPTSSNLFTHTLSPSPSKDAHPSPNIDQDTNTNSRKRKRTASLTSSLSDTDEPLAKRRSSSHKDMEAPTSPPEAGVLDLQDADMEEKLEHVEEAISPEEGAANGVNEDEAATPVPTIAVKGRRGKKGKRKGGRKPFGQAESELIGDPAEALAEEEDAAEVVEAEAEEEDNSSNGELVAKKRSAMDAFNGIEKEFAAFRERHLNEQLLQINRDLDLLRHDLHPEYLAQQRCIDNHRDTKLKHERALQGYKNESLRIKIVAERTQLHSQFFQEVRELKEKTLEKCYTDLYALQKDRRRWGADESNYNYLYNPKRTLQIQQQASYNLEVSILSGVAKHVGFPAAPDINGLVTADIDSDFAAMQV
ncbi:hypothetical protein EJ08DRAFT_291242 [Tothia fuscella]|uniref:Transcriptional regulatory protein DEP1 n=1 Tax=Tothia fuscella TaxID=1048955 RepID=A0A9P4U2J1_9PEZI|nr:hypothetical protein EJ08DRAFT_291242 [Tothia fuscella]